MNTNTKLTFIPNRKFINIYCLEISLSYSEYYSLFAFVANKKNSGNDILHNLIVMQNTMIQGLTKFT